MPHLFDPLIIRPATPKPDAPALRIRNRIMLSPMIQNSATSGGLPTDWHSIHYATRAVGGVGLIMLEATSVQSGGRITEEDLGLWDDRQIKPLGQVVALCHDYGATVGLQLAHAGRKAWDARRGRGPELPVGPSAIPFGEGWAAPHALTLDEIDALVQSFRDAAERARYAAFDVIELHAAHGYLINQFLSPVANRRADEYGGSLENRLRFLLRLVQATREVWADRLLFVRVSAAEYVPGGVDPDEMVEIARTLKGAGVDLMDISSGGAAPEEPPAWPAYQVPFSERIRREAGIPTAAVGLITQPELAEEIVRNGRANLVALGRELLRNPYWPLQAARALGVDLDWPRPYRDGKLPC